MSISSQLVVILVFPRQSFFHSGSPRHCVTETAVLTKLSKFLTHRIPKHNKIVVISCTKFMVVHYLVMMPGTPLTSVTISLDSLPQPSPLLPRALCSSCFLCWNVLYSLDSFSHLHPVCSDLTFQ